MESDDLETVLRQELSDATFLVDAPDYVPGALTVTPPGLKPPWQPGQSGNPNGNRGPLIVPAMRRLLDKYSLDELKALDPNKLRIAEAIAHAAILQALERSKDGDRAREQLMNRLDGPVEAGPQAIAQAVIVQRVNSPDLGMRPRPSEEGRPKDGSA